VKGMSVTDGDRYAREREHFDAAAKNKKEVTPMSKAMIDRYAHPRRPHLFPREYLFHCLGDLEGKKVLDLGCGEGLASVQLAHAGAEVMGLDISPESIAVARRRADVNNVMVDCRVANIETDELGSAQYDVVWCNDVLHHIVPSLDLVIRKVKEALKPGGQFIAREPVAYARWLKAIRHLVPITTGGTPDEQSLGRRELEIILKYFPDAKRRYFEIVARIRELTKNRWLITRAAQIDNLLLTIPGMNSLAGTVVICAEKE